MTRPLLLLNDIHLGVQRVAGTTPDSQLALKQALHAAFGEFIGKHHDKDLCIVGDLFDGFTVDITDVLECYFTLVSWLETMNNGRKLYLVAGNHDIGKRNDRTSSFDVLATLLRDRVPTRVFVIKSKLETICEEKKVYAIPHCMNQDLFDIEMKKALDLEPGFLLLHANVDNGFAENSDHSLNVDAEWLTRLSKRHTLMFAHEHQHRMVKYDHKPIFVMGNQWPSSVADCLAHGEAQKDGIKQAHVIHVDGKVEPIMTWARQNHFEQMQWTDLKESPARFIRIAGEASANQASDVISAIAKYRQKSPAFVITNGVKIEGVAQLDGLSETTFEQVKSFDVLKALLDMLDPKEANAVRELMEVQG